MSDIAKLTVALYANSAQFVSELNKSQKKASNWSSKVSGSFSMVGKATAAAAAASVGALSLLYKQQSQYIDQAAKHADTIGITTEALTQFRHAAELTGVGASNLDTSLQRMTRRIAEASAGTGEAKNALNELGVSAKYLNSVTPEQQLYVLADAFSQVENQSDRVRYAFKLFDSEGVKMANMLAGGAGGLRSMADEADALGITLSRIDAAKIEMANDAMYKVSASTDAWKRSIAVELTPLLASVADEITHATKAAGGFGVVTAEVFEGVIKGAGFAADVWRGWELIIKSSSAAAQGYRLSFMAVWQTIIDGATSAGEAIVKSIVWPMQASLNAIAPFNDQAAELAASLDDITSFKSPQLFNLADAKLDYSKAVWELRSLASEPLPSEGIEAWYNNAKVRIQDAAEIYAQSINRNGTAVPSGVIATSSGSEESQAVKAFRDESEGIQQEYIRRLAIAAAGNQAIATQEVFAYQDRQAKLSQQFQAAYEAAANNQNLQQELENQYFNSREVLWQGHQDRLNDIEEKAGKARMAAKVAEMRNYSDLFGSMSDIAGTFAGEQSGIYKAMFTASKAFAIAESIIKIQQGIASAAALPFPANIPAMASVAASTASIVSTIQGTQLNGMAHDGSSGFPGGRIPKEGTWLLDGGEKVQTKPEADRHERALSMIEQGKVGGNKAPNVRVIVNEAPPGTYAESSFSDEELIVNVMMKDANSGGRYMSYIQQKLGVKPGGYK
ncbi:hypothetical protein ACLAC2_004653 [Vibrio alginolyticus]